MKKLKLLLICFCCFSLAVFISGCTNSKSSNNTGSGTSSPEQSETANTKILGFAFYLDLNNTEYFAAEEAVKNDILINDDALTTNNNLIKVIYSKNKFSTYNKADYISNTTFDTNTTSSINNKLILNFSLEVFPETKNIYAFVITKNVNGTNTQYINICNFINNKQITYNLTSNIISAQFSKINFDFKADISTSDL